MEIPDGEVFKEDQLESTNPIDAANPIELKAESTQSNDPKETDKHNGSDVEGNGLESESAIQKGNIHFY